MRSPEASAFVAVAPKSSLKLPNFCFPHLITGAHFTSGKARLLPVAIREIFPGAIKDNTLVLGRSNRGRKLGRRKIRKILTCRYCVLLEAVKPRAGDICDQKVTALHAVATVEDGYLVVEVRETKWSERFARL